MITEDTLRAAAALESLRAQLHNLEETIGRLVRLQKTLPAGPAKEQLLEEVSALDSIADVVRQALDSCAPQDEHGAILSVGSAASR